jgi:inosose dehydratase
MADVLAIAKEAKKIGIEILVTNPTPIRWGGPENKSDEQLKTQALALNVLGKELRSIGLTLAYHNHDAEMRESAREFHHMLAGTESNNVKLCLDAHWIYRGSGNSQVALFDIVELYADRIVELHLRQSHDGIWSEVFEDGDIDYARLANTLKQKGIQPHVVLEQAVEEGTPQTMNTVEAMNKSLRKVEKLFG